MPENFSPLLQHALRLATHQARQHAQANFGGGHVLYGLLDEDTGLHEVFELLGQEVPRLRQWASFRLEHYPKSSKVVESPEPDEGVSKLYQEANRISAKAGSPQVEPIHALEALCAPGVVFSAEQLMRFPIRTEDVAQFRQPASTGSGVPSAVQDSSASTGNRVLSKTPETLRRFCDDLTDDARSGRLDPVIGRDRELQEMIQVLGKRISPNIILVGEPGVGKTAIVGGLAQAIVGEKVPQRLVGTSLLELDVHGRLVAGAYKGEVEERLKKILQAAKQQGNVILFIDEIHALLDDRASVGAGAISLLKPELARGDITLIGATTHAEYRKYFEKDAAFARRFTRMEIEPPTEKLAVRMVKGLLPRFEQFHGLPIDEAALPEGIRLASRYFTNKRLPASAVELIDLTASTVKLRNDTSASYLAEIRDRLSGIEEGNRPQLLDVIDYAVATLSPLLLAQLEEPLDLGSEEGFGDMLKNFEANLAQLERLADEPIESVGETEMISIAAQQAGVPIGDIRSEEGERLQHLEEHLRARVLGQDHVLEEVAASLKRSRVLDQGGNKPRGKFFFAGPTGTGKTELAKAIAQLLFGDEKALVRFDMSEYMEKHAAEALVGAPPGFVGYEEGGRLVNSIRQKPYSVLLFDEIEKAHSNAYKLFLQILDEARLTDRQGKKGDFSNAILIFTSNVASDWIQTQFSQGEIPSGKDLRDQMKALKDGRGEPVFAPEFIGRFDNVIPFAPITQEVADLIFDLQLARFQKRLDQHEIQLEIAPAAKKAMVAQIFDQPVPEDVENASLPTSTYGARPIAYMIEEQLGTPIAEKMIGGDISGPTLLVVGWDEETESLSWDSKVIAP